MAAAGQQRRRLGTAASPSARRLPGAQTPTGSGCRHEAPGSATALLDSGKEVQVAAAPLSGAAVARVPAAVPVRPSWLLAATRWPGAQTS